MRGRLIFALVAALIAVAGLYWLTTRHAAQKQEAAAPAPPSGSSAAAPDTATGWTPADTSQGGP